MIVDTLRFSKLLHEKGHFSVEQANTLAETIGTVTTEGLATKVDIAEIRTEIAELKTELKTEIAGLRTEISGLRTELKGEIGDLRTELKGEIGGLRSELLKWIVGAMGLQTIVIIVSLYAFLRATVK